MVFKKHIEMAMQSWVLAIQFICKEVLHPRRLEIEIEVNAEKGEIP